MNAILPQAYVNQLSKSSNVYHCGITDAASFCRCGDCSHAPNDPVCGLDSITYINTCELKKSNCLNNKFIEIKHNGSCRRK